MTSTLNMVTIPAIKGKMVNHFKKLFKIVENNTDLKINIYETDTYSQALDDLKNKKAQLGWVGISTYLEGCHNADIEAFAVGVRNTANASTYKTLFIAKKDSNITNIHDLKGKTIALTEKGSTSGDLMPRFEMKNAGINYDNGIDLKKISYCKSSEAAIASLLSDKSDVAAISDINYESLISEEIISKSKFKIVHQTPEIPGPPLVYIKSLDDNLKEKIKNAVLNAHKSGEIGGYGKDIIKYQSKDKAREDFFNHFLKVQWGYKTYIFSSLFIILSIFIYLHLKINLFESFSNSYEYCIDILKRMTPPDFSNYKQLLLAMLQTIEIGFLGTLLAVFLSIPFGLMAAKNISPFTLIYYSSRFLIIFFRAIPEFIIAMILVIAVGFGALPAIFALGIHTMGFLAKFFAEEIEHVDKQPIEALKTTGANFFQIFSYGIIPQILPSFTGFILYIFDRNIRMATMLGIVGGGGIGYHLQSSFRMFNYKEVSAIIIIIFVTIFFIDLLSSKIRHAIK